MLRKLGMTLSFALLLILLLSAGVMAQTGPTGTEAGDTAAPSVQPVLASVAQAVPLTLTVNVPGPTGTITVEVPVVLLLDLRIGIGDSITAALAVTPSQVITQSERVTVPVAGRAAPETPAAVETLAPTAAPTAQPTRAAAGATLTPTPAAAATEAPEEPAEPTPTPQPAPTATPLLDTPTPEPTPTEEAAEVLAPVCSDPGASITAPGVNQVVSGTVNILGTASHPNFQYYKVEYAPGADVSPDDNFAYLTDARTQVQGGVLASFDSTQFDNGPYTFKLTVVDNTGNFPPPCTVTVVIEN
ncbi:MAG: hypothetical protein IT329_03860 [Caldilineaceae bacterium]|nr:hypothetical protein [Caldilineaceae bacterium]